MEQAVDIARLRIKIAAIAPATQHGTLALDGSDIDAALGGGLPLGALHAIEGAGMEAETCTVPTAFLASVLSRLPGQKKIIWIARVCDLYAPGLVCLGFDPARLIQVRSTSDTETLACMETLLRAASPGAVVAEVGRVSAIAARRLQMACLGGGCTGFLLRRWPHGRRESDEITSAVTRWRLGPSPSRHAFGAPGPARWHVELLYTRAGPPGAWIVEQENRDDSPYPVRVAAGMADPQAAPRRLAG